MSGTHTGMVGLSVNLWETRALQLLPNCSRKLSRGNRVEKIGDANLLAVGMKRREVSDRNRGDKHAALKFGHIPTATARYRAEFKY